MTLPSELLAPVPPFEAYREDVARVGGCARFGASDDVWLLTSHALARAAALDVTDRPAVLTAAAEGIEAIGGAAGVGTALRALAGAVAGTEDYNADDLATIQQFVAAQEQAGAFRLAHVTLGALRDALAPALDARAHGLLLAQQGRAARQLGALDAAREHYRAAAREARRAGAADVAARAQLGLGVLANMRGNYPEARASFRRALVAARRAGAVELRRAGHQGLLVAAVAAQDIDLAIAHGWAAVRYAAPDAPIERAEALVNVAGVGQLAGAYRAALGAALAVLALTELPRLRLPALGTAVAAAAALDERLLLEHLVREVDRTIARSGVPFDNARILLDVAEALAVVNDPRAAEYAERAHTRALEGGFHEICLRAESVVDRPRRDDVRRPARDASDTIAQFSVRTRAALRSMETLPAAARFASGVMA